jgi:uncharacterized membrane protein YdfJ with MMPL/SSD domain
MRSLNLPARAGRWSASHRKTAVVGWILFVVLATLIGGAVGKKELERSAMGNGESKRAELIIDAADFPEEVREQVLVQGHGADDPRVQAAVKDVVSRLERIDGVSDIESPLRAADRAKTVSKDARSVVVNFTLPGDPDDTDALERVAEAPLAAVAAVQTAHPDVRVEEYGTASERNALGAQERKDEARSLQLSMAGTLVILLLAFGAAVAAGVPLLLGLTAVVATTGLLGPVSQLAELHEAVGQVVLLVGLAVGVDYAMFYLRRMMEEQGKGRSSEAALEVAAATSGRAVVISGLTVMAAMAGMFFSGNPIFVSFGIGTIIVVGVAVVGSLTVLPAMLSFLGQKGWLEKGRVPWVARRRQRTGGESRVWGALLDRVLARPLISVLAAGGVLIALSIPALGMQFKAPGTEGMSRSQPIMQTLDRIDAAFPGGTVPATTVIKAEDVTTPEVQSAIRALHDQAIASGQLSEPSSVEVSPDKTVAIVSLSVNGKGTDAASNRSIQVLRDEIVPATVGKLQDAEVAVGGVTAWTSDFVDAMKSHLPIVFGFVLARVHPAAGDVPLDRGADQGDRPEPAVGRRGLRHSDPRLPGRARREAARFQLRGWHYAVAAALPVRDPVRPVDGLPRPRAEPDSRGGRPGHAHRARRRARHQEHRRRDHERRGGDGDHVRDVRHRRRSADEAARRRARRGDPHRRDGRPRRPAPRHDEALRRAELVPTQAPAVAAEARARAGGDAGRRLSLTASKRDQRRPPQRRTPFVCD